MKAARIAPWVALGAAAVLVPLGVLVLRDVKADHEPALRGPSAPAWHAHIGAVDDALARTDVSAAAQAWHAGYRGPGEPGLGGPAGGRRRLSPHR
jgi:hypothetical protein